MKKNKSNNKNFEEPIANTENNKNIKSKISIILTLVFGISLILGLSYAMYNYSKTGSNNKLIAGDIYLRYINGNTKNISMIPSDTYNPSDYFEFTIMGKNQSNKDIIYDIVLDHGDNLNSPFIRLDDSFLRFRLVTVENDTETEIFTDENYDEINNTRIHVGRIIGNNDQEVNVTYRLYVWVNGVLVGNTDHANYTSDEWANVYTNIKVNVTGDYTDKTLENRVKVTFDANGGTVNTNSKTVRVNSTYGGLPTPTRDGYTFIGWIESSLPSEYQEVEYIESSGSQYINTEIIPSNTTGVYAKLSSSNITSDLIYFGSRNTLDGRFWVGNKESQIYYGWNTNTYGSTNITADTVNIIKHNYLNDRKSMFNDEVIINIGSTGLSSNTRPIYIFAGNDIGSASYKSSIKLNEFKITDGNIIIHNYIPCYRIADGVIGLYDIVEGKFYIDAANSATPFEKGDNLNNYIPKDTNNYITKDTIVTKQDDHTLYAIWQYNPKVTFDANGGTVNTNSKTVKVNSKYGDLPTPTRDGYTFLGWKPRNDDYILPSEYQEVEYIGSAGSQFIELPFGFERTDIVDFDVSIESDQSSDSYMVAPKTWNNNSNRFAMGGIYYSQFTCGFGSKSTESTPLSPSTTNDGDRHQWHYENSIFSISDLNIMYNGTSVTFGGVTTNLKLFYGYNTNTKGKIYRYTHWKNNVKAIDLIPCYRKDDDVRGLYDLINGVFYTDAANSSTPFGKGNDISNIITKDTIVSKTVDHTLYAIWKED